VVILPEAQRKRDLSSFLLLGQFNKAGPGEAENRLILADIRHLHVKQRIEIGTAAAVHNAQTIELENAGYMRAIFDVGEPASRNYELWIFLSAAISWVFFSTSRSVRWRLSRSLFRLVPGDRGLCWLSIVGRSKLP